ncbi:MAG: hypothetical protein V3U92_19185 [Cellulophaga sp.]
MKTKRIIYFLCLVFGASVMGFGNRVVEKEYALSIGIVFLMFGIYKFTTLISSKELNEEGKPNDIDL